MIARAAAEKMKYNLSKTSNLLVYTLHLQFETHLADYEYSTKWVSIRVASLLHIYFFYIFFWKFYIKNVEFLETENVEFYIKNVEKRVWLGMLAVRLPVVAVAVRRNPH